VTFSATGLPENAAAATALLAQGQPALVWRRIIADSDTPVTCLWVGGKE
jgi:anthranilate synthase component 1